jgi:agmatinase
MTNLSDDELHAKHLTFMGAPYTHDLSGAKAAVLRVPFDCGIHPFRIGSRQGPAATLGQSMLVRRYRHELADLDPLAAMFA